MTMTRIDFLLFEVGAAPLLRYGDEAAQFGSTRGANLFCRHGNHDQISG
jgi:hypothetical protein